MTTPNDRLKNMLRAELSKPPRHDAPTGSQMPALGAFLRAAMENAGHSRADLARMLEMDPLLVDGILDGLLPDSELDDSTLVELARAVNFDPNVLRGILGRPMHQDAHKPG